MADRPILFSSPMVRALLEGRKTMTRRVLSNNRFASIFNGQWADSYVLDPGNAEWRAREVRYAVGDRLWVRETWRVEAQDDRRKPSALSPRRVGYVADEKPGTISRTGKKRPGIFMPRWASRLTLTVTDVRVQRLQDISEADAVAEGIEGDWSEGWRCYLPEPKAQTHWADPRESYGTLWDSLNASRGYGWETNPWVICLSFEVHRTNIDRMEGVHGRLARRLRRAL